MALGRAAAVPAGHSVDLKLFPCFDVALLASDFLLALAGLLAAFSASRPCASSWPQRPPAPRLSWGSSALCGGRPGPGGQLGGTGAIGGVLSRTSFPHPCPPV